MSRLWYQTPAAEWEEALPIGNGRLRAMVYGGTDRKSLQVNEENMWYGGAVNRLNPDAKNHLLQIREYLNNGGISEAERLMETALSGCPDSMHSYTLYKREYFASYPADCILTRFTAEGEGTVDFLARLRRGNAFTA